MSEFKIPAPVALSSRKRTRDSGSGGSAESKTKPATTTATTTTAAGVTKRARTPSTITRKASYQKCCNLYDDNSGLYCLLTRTTGNVEGKTERGAAAAAATTTTTCAGFCDKHVLRAVTVAYYNNTTRDALASSRAISLISSKREPRQDVARIYPFRQPFVTIEIDFAVILASIPTMVTATQRFEQLEPLPEDAKAIRASRNIVVVPQKQHSRQFVNIGVALKQLDDYVMASPSAVTTATTTTSIANPLAYFQRLWAGATQRQQQQQQTTMVAAASTTGGTAAATLAQIHTFAASYNATVILGPYPHEGVRSPAKITYEFQLQPTGTVAYFRLLRDVCLDFPLQMVPLIQDALTDICKGKGEPVTSIPPSPYYTNLTQDQQSSLPRVVTNLVAEMQTQSLALAASSISAATVAASAGATGRRSTSATRVTPTATIVAGIGGGQNEGVTAQLLRHIEMQHCWRLPLYVRQDGKAGNRSLYFVLSQLANYTRALFVADGQYNPELTTETVWAAMMSAPPSFSAFWDVSSEYGDITEEGEESGESSIGETGSSSTTTTATTATTNNNNLTTARNALTGTCLPKPLNVINSKTLRGQDVLRMLFPYKDAASVVRAANFVLGDTIRTIDAQTSGWRKYSDVEHVKALQLVNETTLGSQQQQQQRASGISSSSSASQNTTIPYNVAMGFGYPSAALSFVVRVYHVPPQATIVYIGLETSHFVKEFEPFVTRVIKTFAPTLRNEWPK